MRIKFENKYIKKKKSAKEKGRVKKYMIGEKWWDPQKRKSETFKEQYAMYELNVIGLSGQKARVNISHPYDIQETIKILAVDPDPGIGWLWSPL